MNDGLYTDMKPWFQDTHFSWYRENILGQFRHQGIYNIIEMEHQQPY